MGIRRERNRRYHEIRISVIERKRDFVGVLYVGERSTRKAFPTEAGASAWAQKERASVLDKRLGAVVTPARIRAQLTKRGLTIATAAQMCGVSYVTMHNYVSGRSKVRYDKLRPILIDKAPATPRRERTMSPKQRAKEAAEIAESIRGRMHAFPAAWKDDIEGMLIRLDAQVEAWEGKKKQPKGSEVAA